MTPDELIATGNAESATTRADRGGRKSRRLGLISLEGIHHSEKVGVAQ